MKKKIIPASKRLKLKTEAILLRHLVFVKAVETCVCVCVCGVGSNMAPTTQPLIEWCHLS